MTWLALYIAIGAGVAWEAQRVLGDLTWGEVLTLIVIWPVALLVFSLGS